MQGHYPEVSQRSWTSSRLEQSGRNRSLLANSIARLCALTLTCCDKPQLISRRSLGLVQVWIAGCWQPCSNELIVLFDTSSRASIIRDVIGDVLDKDNSCSKIASSTKSPKNDGFSLPKKASSHSLVSNQQSLGLYANWYASDTDQTSRPAWLAHCSRSANTSPAGSIFWFTILIRPARAERRICLRA